MKINKRKNIVIIDNDHIEGIPTGKDVFYLCLNCRSVIQSYPNEYATCKCGNVSVDIDGGRGGAKVLSQLLILKLE